MLYTTLQRIYASVEDHHVFQSNAQVRLGNADSHAVPKTFIILSLLQYVEYWY